MPQFTRKIRSLVALLPRPLLISSAGTPLLTTGVEVSLAAALQNLRSVFLPGRVRILYFVNFAFYLGIFGFFRCYPM